MANNKDFKLKNGIQPTVYHEGLGTVTSGSVTVGYGLESAAYDSIDSASLSTQIVQGQGISFKPDGTSMYVNDQTDVYQYTLSTAWDLSTLSYASKTLSLSSAGTDPNNNFFKDDGTKFYVCDSNGGRVHEYALSTAWDISTASYTDNFNSSFQASGPTGIFFKPDGLKLYVSSANTDTVYQYTLSTAWDVSTASYDSVSFSVASEQAVPRSVQLSPDGTKMFILGRSNPEVHEYDLSTPWDISSASYSGNVLSVSSQDTFPYSMTFKADGQKLYVFGATSDKVHQYSTGSTTTTATLDLSTGSVFEITPTSDIQIGLNNPADSGTVSQATLLLDGAVNGYDLSGAAYDSVSFSVSSQSTAPQGLSFSYDGSKMYVIDNSNRDIFQYSLSTSWDVSSASYDSVFFDVGTQDTGPFGIFFKTDGTKLYVCGGAGNDINEYSLSTAWDLSSISFVTNFSVSGQTGDPNDIYFTNDGTKFYVNGGNNDVYQYSCSTAWDISTASYDSKSFSSVSQTSQLEGLWLKSDGSKMFLLDRGNLSVFQYSLSTAYDVSTASYDSVSFSISSQDGNPQGIYFKPDGDKFYFVGATNDNVFQYSSGSAYTVTYDSTLQWGGGTAPDSPAANETDVLTFTTRDGGTTYQAAIAIDGAA